MTAFLYDLRDALRSTLKNPGFAALLVGVLGAGLACVIFMLTLLDGFILRPLPFAEPEQLVQAGFFGDGGLGNVFPVDSRDLAQLQRYVAPKGEVAAAARSTINLSDFDRAERRSTLLGESQQPTTDPLPCAGWVHPELTNDANAGLFVPLTARLAWPGATEDQSTVASRWVRYIECRDYRGPSRAVLLGCRIHTKLVNGEPVSRKRRPHREPQPIGEDWPWKDQTEDEGFGREDLLAIKTQHALLRDDTEILRAVGRAHSIRDGHVHHSPGHVDLERDDWARRSQLKLEKLPLLLKGGGRPKAF